MTGKRKNGSWPAAGKTPARYWSADAKSAALDLQPKVFTWKSPRRIAGSLKRSAEASTRRKGTPYQAAMSMLTFYVNRAGGNLPQERRQVLEDAKGELRKLFGAIAARWRRSGFAL